MEFDIFLSQFLTIIVVHFLAVSSPGPDFAITIKQSISYNKKIGIYTSLGIGIGILLHVTYSLLGFGLIISQSVIAYSIMKLIGGFYLLYMGYKSIKAKSDNNDLELSENKSMPTNFQAIKTGFLTNALNPKATLFFLSLFTAIISKNTPTYAQLIYGVYMAIATFLWFAFVSTFFSHSKIKNNFKKFGHWFERVMGGVLFFLGYKLITSSQ